ncbi:GHKL domain-containing protein [Arthrobacter sp. ES3-54]|uniref:GHKL domain-containing protein n=1 Tax=Arthrobacter sp. ES3-54 TaxID=1502991 RepID=UPI002406968A|nr:GHKL domain-containing protein [Arthrobacter sp. ES3-54]MDF9751458.1 hypothetical protein [Arthrobacter sp. ES3-54]
MNDDRNLSQLRTSLESPLASERGTAAQALLSSEEQLPIDVLVTALEKETVPMVRDRLRLLMKKRPANSSAPTESAVTDTLSDTESMRTLEELLGNAGSIIRHETEPAIGLLRRAATRDIENFKKSETNAQIEILRETIDSVVLLLNINRPSATKTISLDEFMEKLIERQGLASDVDFDRIADNDGKNLLTTNPGLLDLALVNALRNAFEARSLSESQSKIRLSYELGPSDFWIKVSNPFDGTTLAQEDVLIVGASSKGSSRGLGMRTIDLVAKRLGYGWSISGIGGIVHFTIWGKTEDVTT